jgi:prepilin-type N-terminal cleavage/methylation domain-containing protein
MARITLKPGFTLAELLMVLAIGSILVTGALIGGSNVLRRSRDAMRLADMQIIEQALRMYYQDHGHYPRQAITGAGAHNAIPDTGEIIGGPTESNIDTALSPYLDHIPGDPLHDGTNYYYAYDPNACIIPTISACPHSCPANSTGVVFGIRRFEGNNSQIRRDTICASGLTNMQLSESSYNIGLFPAP